MFPDQAYVFATVNLAQTKVNRSLVYDALTIRGPGVRIIPATFWPSR